MTSPWMMTNEEAILLDSVEPVNHAQLPVEPLVVEDRSMGIAPAIFDGEYEDARGKFPFRAGRWMHE
jgi:hypothetical protein